MSGTTLPAMGTVDPDTPLQLSSSTRIEEATKIIQETFSSFDPANIGISFNGGKDSILMMELLRRVVGSAAVSKCFVFTLEETDEFEELRQFRNDYMRDAFPTVEVYHYPMPDSMRATVQTITEEHPLEAVFMGTRQTDPSGKYQSGPIAPTTPGWPHFLRVCPLFFWSVSDVWSFILHHSIPFCVLYQQGYTSLGRRSSTKVNPRLVSSSGSFHPAWHLVLSDAERDGRVEEAKEDTPPG